MNASKTASSTDESAASQRPSTSPAGALAGRDQSLSEIMAALRAIQKSNRGAGGYARWVNRRIGRLFAAIAFKAGFTPNQVTIVSALFTFPAIVFIAVFQPTLWTGVIIALMLEIGFALDAADGQLARLRGGGSPAGEWLDHVVDSFKCSAFHVAILICWFRFYDLPNDALLLIPIVFGLQYTVFYFTIMLTEQLRRSASGITSSSRPKTNEPAPILRSIIVLPNDYGILSLSLVLLGFPVLFFWFYTLMTLINIVFLLGALPKWYREMVALSKPKVAA
jgi:phosphatidylglycerophosphate synthase